MISPKSMFCGHSLVSLVRSSIADYGARALADFLEILPRLRLCHRQSSYRFLSSGKGIHDVSLQDQVEKLLPGWRRWYPSLFEAARDLGIIRARVCSPDSLLLSNRHANIRRDAEDAHREKWGGQAQEPAMAGKRQRRKRTG
ncbi:MAG: hypothetical protein OEQ25_13560 [Gammaproteobacteria bacterium]|nr:hypothetical protein [Gammaproteobacteria bacterium]